MAENLPIHMSDEEEIVDNESEVSELSNNDEEIEYDPVSEKSLDPEFDEEDDELQAPLVPQQPLIPSQQQPRLHPRSFCNSCDQMRCNIRPPALPAYCQQLFQMSSAKAFIPQEGLDNGIFVVRHIIKKRQLAHSL